ncbi:NAD kinase [Corynebacterium sp. 32222D000AT]|uniref:NAD kinase n=1 Tax=unclassified Corynebacterium TaxID=2624378 RepID=UPI002A937BCE|nr:NAD kinase [Mycobacteriaceae bacterium]MDY5829579.1 NAD kinase [Corynebacterium sp.]
MSQENSVSQEREILLVPHAGRSTNLAATDRAAQLLDEAGIVVRVCAPAEILPDFPHVQHTAAAAEGCELVLVLGGDGTFLRAADMARAVDVPVLGINLGHVGFLAEWEAESLDKAIERVVARQYRIEDRMTIDVTVTGPDDELIGRSWALNEVSMENLNRSGVLDAILEVDARPVMAFGCDGVLISTPTGSTAYAFSAGGPVLWPELDAILVVPNNAHALFTKPLVVSPKSTVAVESASETSAALVNMDGFREIAMPPGSRVEVVRGERPVRWVRLDDHPFTDRLVSKLRLPVEGWRGPQR